MPNDAVRNINRVPTNETSVGKSINYEYLSASLSFSPPYVSIYSLAGRRGSFSSARGACPIDIRDMQLAPNHLPLIYDHFRKSKTLVHCYNTRILVQWSNHTATCGNKATICLCIRREKTKSSPSSGYVQTEIHSGLYTKSAWHDARLNTNISSGRATNIRHQHTQRKTHYYNAPRTHKNTHSTAKSNYR